MPEPTWRTIVGVIVLVYALISLFYITATPLQAITLPDNLPQTSDTKSIRVGIGPDEKEHYLYIVSLAERGKLPTPLPRFRTDPAQYISYEAQHPPLFYAVAAVVYKLTATLGDDLRWYLLRGLCAVCGGFVIVLTARAARVAFPNWGFFSLVAAPAVAFLPMLAYMTGTLSNEPLALALGAWAWLQIVRLLRSSAPPTPRDALTLAFAVGLAALARLTAIIWLPAALFALTIATRRGTSVAQNRRQIIALFLGTVGVLLLPWFLYNQIAFGTPFLRTFYRPLISATLSPDPATLRLFALFYVTTAWYPHWLVQFYLPGGTSGIVPLLVVVLDMALLLSLLQHASTERRAGGEHQDKTGRIIIWAGAGTLILVLLAVIEQNLFVDWDVALSAGRYIIAALPAATLLFCLAVASPLRGQGMMIQRIIAGVVALLLLGADLVSLTLVRRFYAEHPTQPSVQPIVESAAPNSPNR